MPPKQSNGIRLIRIKQHQSAGTEYASAPASFFQKNQIKRFFAVQRINKKHMRSILWQTDRFRTGIPKIGKFIQKHPGKRPIIRTVNQYTKHTGIHFILGRKIRATRSPNTIAAAIPPAVAVNPPVKAPRRPFSSTAFSTPVASE